MIDRQHGNLIFECDTCGETGDTDVDEFAEAWAVAKRDGWRTRHVGNDWLHVCPDCQKQD